MSVTPFRVFPIDRGPWRDDTTAVRQHRVARLVYPDAGHAVSFRYT